MSRSRSRLNPHGQKSLFDESVSGSATAGERQGTPETDLMSVAIRPEVLSEAISRVKSNGGAPGIDGKTVEDLDVLWRTHGERICQVLLAGDYLPLPVRRVTIPKPGGGERLLGIPTVQDRVIQQMLLIVLEPLIDPTFSDSSFGFRPGRSAHDAVRRAEEHAVSGRNWVVDLDLEKFFDTVNHDVLMNRLARRISDKRVLKLIRRYLKAGMMLNGVVMETEEGTPQGGPLSPLLANVLLDDLDKELERRGHRFVRYADDCNLYVGSEEAARRVLDSVTHFLEVKLRLKVNRSKSAFARVSKRPFLGFRLTRWSGRRSIRISEEALSRFKAKIRSLTSRVRRIRSSTLLSELNRYLRGWAGYYARFAGCRPQLKELDSWIRRRLRQWLWVQWKTSRVRRRNLLAGGVFPRIADLAVGTVSAWKASACEGMHICVTDERIRHAGLIPLTEHWQRFASL